LASSQDLEQKKAQQTIKRWRRIGPALWAQECLGAKPTEQQLEGGREIVRTRRVSIRSGHGTGKTAFMAWCVLWFMSCYAPCKIPCTAPTGHQLSDILWAELATWHRILKERMPALGLEFEWTAERFELKSHPRESFAVARTSRPERPEALQGFHSEYLLFLIDESSGIPEEVFQVAEGALSTPDAFVAMAANPTRMDGYFYDSHHKMRASWSALHWDGENSPLVSKKYVEEMAQKYGRESAIFRIRVKGEFAGNPDGVIPLDVIESAIGRLVKPFGDVRWGLDVARFGEDRTALCKRQGNAILEPIKWWSGKDTMQVAGIIKNEYDATPTILRPAAICVDVIGIGAGVVDRLREMKLPVVAVNVAESPSVKDQYNRLRDELWFKARDWFWARDVCMPRDDALIAELTLPSYKILSNGKKQVESKDDMKKRGVTSPDLADAFCLTFAQGIARGGKWGSIDYQAIDRSVV
jgi:phage terminase large subunit